MIEETSEGKTNYCLACENKIRGFITAVSAHNCGKITYTKKKSSLLFSKWCVKCYPEREPAEFTFQGNSLCEKCFKKERQLKCKGEQYKCPSYVENGKVIDCICGKCF